MKLLIDSVASGLSDTSTIDSASRVSGDTPDYDPVQLDSGEIAIGANQLDNYLKNTFHYDSAFGTLISAKVSTRSADKDGRESTVTTFDIPDHQFRLESAITTNSGNEKTAFYHNGNPMISKDEDGKPIRHGEFDFKEAPYVKLYKVDGKDFYYVEGSAIDAATPAFQNIVYAFIFDLSANTVYSAAVLNQDRTCYLKAENGHLVVLKTMPLNYLDDIDSLRVKEIILNY